MSTVKLADRVAALEAEVERLKAQVESVSKGKGDWLDRVWGAFANDPIYDKAMALGREYRKAQRPRPVRRREQS